MEGALTPEDLKLLSEWVDDRGGDSESDPQLLSSGDDAVQQLLVEVPDGELALKSTREAPRRAHKKHRATYLKIRDAKEGLRDEVAALESRLAVLKRRAGLEGDHASAGQTAVQNAVMRSIMHQQHMAMVGAHSMLTKSLNVQATHPLYTHVHLGKGQESRCQRVASMRELKLHTASQYLMERTKDLDELLPHSSQDITVDGSGNILCSLFDIVQFTGVRSLREVSDAVVHFVAHEEIVLSEHLGVKAIRHNFDVVNGVSANKRLHCVDKNGITTEWNSVNFGQFINENYAVFTCDNVDVDDRYPYEPDTRVRRDYTGAIMLSVFKANEDESIVVVMRRFGLTKIHQPKFPLTATTRGSLIKTAFGWSEAMLESIRSQLNLSAIAALSPREKLLQ